MIRTARHRTWIGVAALGLAALAIGAPAFSEDPKPAAEKADLARALIGTWVLADSPDVESSPPGPGARLKSFTGTHWMITQPDPKTGEVVFHHGGRYTLDGDTLSGSIDFANANTAEYIGKTHKFTIKVDGDTYTQVGIGNPFNETWKRVK